METPNNSSSASAQPLAPLVVPTITVSTPATGLAGTTVTLTGTNFTGATAVTFGGVPATSFTVVSATKITAVAPAGAGTVQIVVTTPGGTSNGINFTYTIATPVITTAVPSSGRVSGGNTVTLTGSGFTGATAVKFGTFTTTFAVVSPTQMTAVAPAGALGTVNITVITPGGTSNGVLYTYLNPPTLTAVTPNQGPTAGGNTVTLTGTNFTGATAVTFGGVPATSFTVVTNAQITAVVPTGVAGGVPVTVTTPADTTTGSVPYFYLAVPMLTSVLPDSGSTAGGTAVTLTGSGLLAATSVQFGSGPATFTVVSDNQINAIAPAGIGTVTITVITPAGTSNGLNYTHVSAPTLTSVSPNVGPTSGGNTVTLTGTALTTTSSVLFGATPAAYTLVSDTTLTVIAPSHAAGSANVTVTTPGGVTTGLNYSWVGPPQI